MSVFQVPELPYSVKREKRTPTSKDEGSSHLCVWKETWTSGSKHILTCSCCGRTRNISYSKEDEKAVKRGDTLQPVGKDKDVFALKYGHLPGEDPKDVARFVRRHG